MLLFHPFHTKSNQNQLSNWGDAIESPQGPTAYIFDSIWLQHISQLFGFYFTISIITQSFSRYLACTCYAVKLWNTCTLVSGSTVIKLILAITAINGLFAKNVALLNWVESGAAHHSTWLIFQLSFVFCLCSIRMSLIVESMTKVLPLMSIVCWSDE